MLCLFDHRYFPNGELDDGGGAIPPPAAGLIASQAEEELAESLEADFLRVDAWAKYLAIGNGSSPWWRAASAAAAIAHAKAQRTAARGPSVVPLRTVAERPEEEEEEEEGGGDKEGMLSSSRPGSPSTLRKEDPSSPHAGDGAAGAAPLVCLADQLSSVCGGSQVLLARACWQWVASQTVSPRREDTWSVSEPLFGRSVSSGGDSGLSPPEVAELALLGAATSGQDETSGDAEIGCRGGGAWAERCSLLFVQLARACELEAVSIPGYWRNGTRPAGYRCESHNHCWAAVKVGGRWRLVDTTSAALQGGGAPAAPFFVPPEALIYSYFPLEAQWQLLPVRPGPGNSPFHSFYAITNYRITSL